MLTFDAETARFLDDAYQGIDFSRRRNANFHALDPLPGHSVLDLGCGTGLLTVELPCAVGPAGKVVGADLSEQMLETAADYAAGRSNVQLVQAGADALPLDDGALDGAVSVQVFEYVNDVPAALTELHRVLRPGGRLVIGDIHWDSCVWASDDPARMARMITCWDGHLAHRDLPERLPLMLDTAGFQLDNMRPVTFCDTVLRLAGIAAMLLSLMARYAAGTGDMQQDEIAAWQDEQRADAAKGRFFQSYTHFVATARRL